MRTIQIFAVATRHELRGEEQAMACVGVRSFAALRFRESQIERQIGFYCPFEVITFSRWRMVIV